ncbi:MAG: hypothetical protein ABIP71_09030 [Verrucomicrobiota bacterium]
MKNTKRFAMRLMVLIAAVAVTSSYGEQGIKVYSVPKEIKRASTPDPRATDPHENLTQSAASSEGSESPLHWETPSGWKELPPTSLRVGNFLISKEDKKAQVSILPFPGKTGTELGNVNRWRKEIGLEAVTESNGENVMVGDQQGKIYDLSGAELQTVAAILLRGDTSWFFKMRGDKVVVAENKAAFIAFLKSIHFHDKEPAAAVAPSAQPAVNAAKEVVAEAESGKPKWDLPSGWREKPASSMVFKTFSSGDAENEAKIAVSVFPGDVGGPLANVNRWRSQLSLQAIQESELSKLVTSIDVIGGKATLVDMNGTDVKTGKPARMIAATVPYAERTWFYKLTGSEAAVVREKEAFLKFIQTVRY